MQIDKQMNSHTEQNQKAHKPGQLYVGAMVRGWKVILCLAISARISPLIYDQTPTQLNFITANLDVRIQVSNF